MPEIVQLLSSTLRLSDPGLHTLRSFSESTSDLDSDGIHLNAIKGHDYVQYLLDQPRSVQKLAIYISPFQAVAGVI